MEKIQEDSSRDIHRRLSAIESSESSSYKEGACKESDHDEENDVDLDNGTFANISNTASALDTKRSGIGGGIPSGTKKKDQITINSKELKCEYEAIRDSVSKLRLPPKYRMNDSKSGINSKDREHAAILIKSGKFVETNLKLCAELKRNWGDLDQMAEIMDSVQTCLAANLRYLQEEHNSLYVGGQYGSQTKSIFKTIQRNTSNLLPEDIEDLKTAVSISQPSHSVSQNPNPGYRGGFGRGTYRGRRGRWRF